MQIHNQSTQFDHILYIHVSKKKQHYKNQKCGAQKRHKIRHNTKEMYEYEVRRWRGRGGC